MTSVEIAILGGGVMGASVAYHLASLGARNVVILDRGTFGEGSTGRATGGYRAQYATPINVRLSLLSRAKLLRFRDETGGDAGYDPTGYLWLATSEAQCLALREARRMQHAEGLTEAREISPADIRELNPAVSLDGLIGGAFCPSDGYVRPLGIMKGYLDAATRLGVRVEWGCEIRGARRTPDGAISALVTSRGEIAVGSVVNATGAWAGEIGRALGVEIPVTPLRRQVAATAPTELLPPRMPMTLFCDDGFHLRVRDGRVLLLRPTAGVPDRPFDVRVDDTWLDDVTARARARLPVLASVPIDRDACWSGLYEMSPDKHAIVGPAPGCSNLFLLNGSSGHGVMHAPALGQLVAEMIVTGRPQALDLHALRPSRFAEGEPNVTSELL